MKNAAPRPGHDPSCVMRGLDPRIHRASQRAFSKKMDGRVKPGHDALAYAAAALATVGTDAIVFKICEAMA
jgi:hypothetical protein